MNRLSLHLILWTALSAAALPASALPAFNPALQAAPADGWAGQAGGTRGGADAAAADIVTVTSAAELRAALKRDSTGARIIQVGGVIDMADGQPFASNPDQARRGTLKLPSNTTLIGLGPDAGLVNAHVRVANVSQVIIRNLHFRNPCDVDPQWDPTDGARGNWNSQFDTITVSASHHVWIDHNSFTDAPVTDDILAIENGKRKQCHDGALDINSGADLVTVSYNRFALHEKNMLIGSSDNATGDAGRLRITLSNNLFEHVSSRAPRVRFGQVHLFNNYHAGDRRHPAYPHDYSVGIGRQARILSHQNAFEIAGARACKDVVRQYNQDDTGASYTDVGSILNGVPQADCAAGSEAGWNAPYPFSARPAALVKAHVLANAGAGKLAPVDGCPTRDFLYCEDFSAAGASGWELSPGSKGQLAVRAEAAGSANRVLHVGGPGALIALPRKQHTAVAPGGAFVEARMRLARGSAAASGQLYVIGAYSDPHNWVGAGIDLAEASDTVQVQLVRMENGVLTRIKQVARARAGAERFSTVRLDMSDAALTAYLNGEKVTTAPLAATATSPGGIGVYSKGASFEVDDVRFGPSAVQPARITPALAGDSITVQAGDPAQLLAVSAVASDGATALPFTVRSSSPAIVAVSAGATGVTITPRAAGLASVIVASSIDPTVHTIVDVTVTAAHVMPAQRYTLARAVMPAVRAAGVAPDTVLRIAFDRPPTLGTSGSVRIFRASDGALVDIIRTGDEVAAIGFPGQARSRYARHTPIKISGNTATIKPHGNKPRYGDRYYVSVDDGVFKNTAIAGVPFRGLGKRAGWSFNTQAAAPNGASLTVDDDGPADFRTIQGALNHAMSRFDKATPVTINVRDGSYEELLFILGKDNLTIRGQSRDGVVIHATNSDGLNPGSGISQAPGAPSFSGGRSLLLIEESDLLTLDTQTIKNTTLRSATRSGQAETLYFNNDVGRLVAKNASFFSEQDTIQVKGYAWFYRTLVAGNVDFIWGANRAALFEESEIRSVGDSANPASGGYVVQARTVTADDPGFVFLNSVLTHGPGPALQANDVPPGATYLARSPGTAPTWDNVSYINCKMDKHIAPVGWAGSGVNGQPSPNPEQAAARSGWREYGTTDLAGKPFELGQRAGGYTLSAAEVAARFGSRAAIFARFGGASGWNPAP